MSADIKKNRIDQIVALCIKNNIPPSKNTFPGFVEKICASRFGLDKRTARSYSNTLHSAWQGDRWKFLVKENPYLTYEEIEKWIKEHSQT